jgi:hypothetical protein
MRKAKDGKTRKRRWKPETCQHLQDFFQMPNFGKIKFLLLIGEKVVQEEKALRWLWGAVVCPLQV